VTTVIKNVAIHVNVILVNVVNVVMNVNAILVNVANVVITAIAK
jgi:hypothetical protein